MQSSKGILAYLEDVWYNDIYVKGSVIAMKKKKNLLVSAAEGAAVVSASVYAINQYIFWDATKKELLKPAEASCYNWKYGNIYYSKTGEGSPVLMLHSMEAFSSGYEWNKMAGMMAGQHTLYMIDLPGFGRSDRNPMIYTNYIYVQAIDAFIREVIGEKTDVITSGDASSVALMATRMKNAMIKSIIMIHPESFDHMIRKVSDQDQRVSKLIKMPLAGTLTYNLVINRKMIREKLEKEYYADKSRVKQQDVDAFYEAAHIGGSNARFNESSRLGAFTRANITTALKECTAGLVIIEGSQVLDRDKDKDIYSHFYPRMKFEEVFDTKALPHMEAPQETAEKCLSLLASDRSSEDD